MKSFGPLGNYYDPPARSRKEPNRSESRHQRLADSSPLEKANDKIEQLIQAKEGHELRIEYLERVIAALCKATGVSVPEPPGL